MVNRGDETLKKVLLRGPILSKSGYGEHCRQIFRYLLKKDVDISIQALNWGGTPWSLTDDGENGLIGEAIKRCDFDPGQKYDVTVQVQLPNEWDPSLGKYNIGVTAGVETDFTNPEWTTVHCSKMDQVIVPSHFSKRGFLKNAQTQTPIDVVPESYFEELREDKTQEIFENNLRTNFNFLTVGVLTGSTPETDRKNLFYLIKWFVEEFKNDSDVGLVIKTNRGRNTSIDKITTRRVLEQILREVDHQGSPAVYLLHGDMSRKEMNNVYKSEKIKAYVTTTRGEGFGLPILEAAVCGLPVIGTKWSAHTEFMDRGRWIAVDYKLRKVASEKIDGQIFLEGMSWAEIDEKDFKKRSRKFYVQPRVPQQWADSLKDRLLEEYSSESIDRKYEEIFSKVLE